MTTSLHPDPLGDIAVNLVQASVADTDELKAYRDGLRAVESGKSGPTLPPSIRKLAGAAAEKLEQVLSGAAADPEEALAAAVRLTCMATSPEPPVAPRLSRMPSIAARASSLAPERGPTLVPAEPDTELAVEFLTEANEHVANAEAALLVLEGQPDDMAAVNTVFRAFHTVKGVSAMLGMTALAQLAHHAESLLARIREGQIRCTGAYANLCLRGIDMLKATLDAVARQLKGEPASLPQGYQELVSALMNPPEPGSPASLVPAKDSEPSLAHVGAPLTPAFPEVSKLLPMSEPAPAPFAPAPTRKSLAPGRKSLGPVARTSSAPAAEKPAAPAPAAPVTRAAAAPAAPAPAADRAAAPAGETASANESSVRVRTDRLDKLIDMVGELVIAQSMLNQMPQTNQARDADLHRKVAHCGKIVRELQDLSMSLRMVPMRPTFQKLTRIVRDVAKKSGKEIQFVSTGDDTEIDRNMVDVIAEPLIHMVRNAADHGVEPTATRLAAGKPALGTVRLAAYHSSGSVVIDLSDDGGGLNKERILAKALQKGLIEPNKILSEQEIYQLIFLPGFSTQENVTDISGRGVGMDVVRKNIESLKGKVEISSEVGKGTKFSIRLPLTLAITDGMLVRVGADRYIIPTVNIAMTFQPEPQQISTVHGKGEVILLRGELIPLFRLYRVFRVPNAVEDPTRGLVVVLRNGNQSCGFLVDELLGQQQVVAKALGSALGPVPAVSGGAILGDGRVGLILDPDSLVALARDTRAHSQSQKRNDPKPPAPHPQPTAQNS
jgi:two-component system, chemotaxis family, sensor kinase CheA